MTKLFSSCNYIPDIIVSVKILVNRAKKNPCVCVMNLDTFHLGDRFCHVPFLYSTSTEKSTGYSIYSFKVETPWLLKSEAACP